MSSLFLLLSSLLLWLLLWLLLLLEYSLFVILLDRKRDWRVRPLAVLKVKALFVVIVVVVVVVDVVAST